MTDSLYNIPLFADLNAEQLEWLRQRSTERRLNPDDYLFKEGDRDDHFYVVLEGELQILRTIGGMQRVLGSTERGDMSGELALLQGVARSATARAIEPTRLLAFDSQAFRAIFAEIPALGFRILQTAASRLSGNAARIKHDEKLAALGKFSAGLAHELNNPASAAQRAAETLNELLPDLLSRSARLCTLGLDEAQIEHLLHTLETFAESARHAAPLSPLAQSDREEELIRWLDTLDVDHSYEAASAFVSSGLTPDDLKAVVQDAPPRTAEGILEWFSAALSGRALLCEIDESTTRISEMVSNVKEYTHMDQGRVQEVDLHKSLETTVKMMTSKLGSIDVRREYDPDLPRITANGSELSQVWTNLIDNAVDALKGKPDGRITLTTRAESDFVMVCIEDNGVGIPEHALPRLFEPFYTTKGVGEGTGLGLDIVYHIVSEHEGSIEVESEPGSTQFIVRLPVSSARSSRESETATHHD